MLYSDEFVQCHATVFEQRQFNDQLGGPIIGPNGQPMV